MNRDILASVPSSNIQGSDQLICSPDIDKAGNRDSLRFPAFHQEMLTQNWWNAGENKGRVKIIITEGHLQVQGILPFIRAKNVVSFSFQHAPLSEHSLFCSA